MRRYRREEDNVGCCYQASFAREKWKPPTLMDWGHPRFLPVSNGNVPILVLCFSFKNAHQSADSLLLSFFFSVCIFRHGDIRLPFFQTIFQALSLSLSLSLPLSFKRLAQFSHSQANDDRPINRFPFLSLPCSTDERKSLVYFSLEQENFNVSCV